MKWKRHENKFSNKLGRCGATGKVIFRTEGAAKYRIKEILNEETNRCHDYMRAFPCIRCGYWHLTSAPNQYKPKEQICNSIPNSTPALPFGTSQTVA